MKAATVVALVLSAAPLAVVGTASAAEEYRNLSAFNGVEFRGSGVLEVVVGEQQELKLVGAPETLAGVRTTVQDGRLVVERRKPSPWTRATAPLVVRVSVPALSAVTVAGDAKTRVSGLTGGALKLVVRGAATFRAMGQVDRLDAALEGSGSMDLSRLASPVAQVAVRGSGDLLVNATRSLDAALNGVGSITYQGNPARVRSAVNGVGRILR